MAFYVTCQTDSHTVYECPDLLTYLARSRGSFGYERLHVVRLPPVPMFCSSVPRPVVILAGLASHFISTCRLEVHRETIQ